LTETAPAAEVSEDVVEQLMALEPEELALLQAQMAWRRTARIKQLPPDQWPASFEFRGAKGPRDWRVWGLRSGRGFGKTRSAAEWLWPEAALDPGSYNFVIAPTFSDVQMTCMQGDSGLLKCLPDELLLDYSKTNLVMHVWTGEEPSEIRGFPAETPERLRGPQSTRVWCDEVASWNDPQEVWDMMRFGLRLGEVNRICWTGTPKPKPFVRHLVEDKDPMTFVIQASTYDNRANLSKTFFESLTKYEGTTIGRQELEGELLNPEEAGIVKRSQFRLWHLDRLLPQFDFIIYSLDTAFTERAFDRKEVKADPSACSVWGLFHYGERGVSVHAVMLLDAWSDHLSLPDLTRKVMKEKGFHYGASTRTSGRGTILDPSKAMPGMGRKSDLIIIEDKGSGISLRQQLATQNIFTHPYNPGRADKLSRLHTVSPFFAHGRVFVPESETNPGHAKSWAEGLISQVCSFVGPGSVDHDDYVDSTTQALRYVMDNLKIDFAESVKKYSDRDRNDKLKQIKDDRDAKRNPYG